MEKISHAKAPRRKGAKAQRRKGAKAQRRKENPFETRQRFAPLRLCVRKIFLPSGPRSNLSTSGKASSRVQVTWHDKYLHEEDFSRQGAKAQSAAAFLTTVK